MSTPAAVRAPVPLRLAAVTQSLILLGLIVAWTLVLHGPSRGLGGADDAFYLEVADLWRHGQPPYLAAFDIKPPGLFALLALAETAFGSSSATLDGVVAACEIATAFLLWRIGVRIGAPAVGVFAAFGYPLLSQTLADNPAYPPLAAATTAAFALACGPWPWRSRAWAAGAAMGFAMAIKQTAVLEAGAALWLLLRDPDAEGDRLGGGLRFAAAAAIAPLALTALLAAEGAFAPLVADVVFASLRRPALEPETSAEVFRHFRSLLLMIWPLAALAAVGLVRLGALAPAAPRGRAEALALWLLAALLELLLQHARWAVYLGPLFAPALLVAGAAAASLTPVASLKRVALAGLLAMTAGTVYPVRMWLFLGPSDAPAVAEAASRVRGRQPAAQDRLLAIAQGPDLNIATGLAPPTPFFYWLHLACAFPDAGPSRLREAFAAAPRFVTTPAEPFHPYCEDPSVWPFIDAALARDYRRLARTQAQGRAIDVYERKPSP